MKFFGRMMTGAAAGGALGAMDGGGFSGAAGGALAGGAVGGFGGMAAKRLAGGRTFSGMAKSGLGRLGGMGQKMTNTGFGMLGQGGIRSNVGAGMAFAGQRMPGFAKGASSLIGQNSVKVNKWGGRALMGAGVASASSIGSSIIGSNQGY